MSFNDQFKIKDFSDSNKWTVQQTLDERWGKGKTELQLADVEIKLHRGDRELTTCPALFWDFEKTNFVVFKVGDSTYKGQFYYKGRDQYGTAVEDFDNILDCVVTVLQVHADLERDKSQDSK
ncbi:hypothetical protein [sulfur-oxidizing endosymbiont of Gigantopelta aegis]|uniref:hypothetical protein n=1 Tax=sulfur-oxidizing endosymbiont of Gigantopelta aegis TaxID=2794934 RepID=UPI0018DC95E8|nr:hypothetical protein [sulfur-oxidizing endosymbiont of Gigantopelta aegis]